MSLHLSYRLYEPKDLNQLLELWSTFSGWGSITREQFVGWYVDTPYGPGIIIIAETETGEIFGHTMFIPSKAILNKNVVKVLRVSAPVIHADVRGTDIRDQQHPVFGMVRLGFEIARREGFSFIYSFPSVGWLKSVKTLGKYGLPVAEIATFDCISYSLEDSSI